MAYPAHIICHTKKTRNWVNHFQTSSQYPMCVLELIGFARDNGDLQGTFVMEGMWGMKKRAHKRRTELINTGPPWRLRMSHSLQCLWLWAKSMAAKWLYLGLSFSPQKSLVLPRKSPFLLFSQCKTLRVTRVTSNYALAGSLFDSGVSSFRAHLLLWAYVSFRWMILSKQSE